MATPGEEVDAVVEHAVDETVLTGQTPRPCVGRHVPEWFGLADARERVAQYRLDELQEPERDLALRVDPVGQILQEVPVEERVPRTVSPG